MADHTPLPWGISYGFSIDGSGNCASYVNGPSSETFGIKLATPWRENAWDDDAEAKANAEFIVRAVNSHYALVEALQWALDELNGRNHYDEDVLDQQMEIRYRFAEEALALASKEN